MQIRGPLARRCPALVQPGGRPALCCLLGQQCCVCSPESPGHRTTRAPRARPPLRCGGGSRRPHPPLPGGAWGSPSTGPCQRATGSGLLCPSGTRTCHLSPMLRSPVCSPSDAAVGRFHFPTPNLRRGDGAVALRGLCLSEAWFSPSPSSWRAPSRRVGRRRAALSPHRAEDGADTVPHQPGREGRLPPAASPARNMVSGVGAVPAQLGHTSARGETDARRKRRGSRSPGAVR